MVSLRTSLSIGLAIIAGLLSGVPVGFFASRRLRFDNPADMSQLYHAAQMNKPPSDGADSLIVEVFVDKNGRVSDYRILSHPLGVKELPMQVKNQLIFTTFRPATFNGAPTTGGAVLTFSDSELLYTPLQAYHRP